MVVVQPIRCVCGIWRMGTCRYDRVRYGKVCMRYMTYRIRIGTEYGTYICRIIDVLPGKAFTAKACRKLTGLNRP